MPNIVLVSRRSPQIRRAIRRTFVPLPAAVSNFDRLLGFDMPDRREAGG